MLPREIQFHRSELRENINRIRNHEDQRVFAEARRFHAVENAGEERDVAVDEVETGFVGLAAKAGGDDEDIAVLGSGVIAGVDALVGDRGGAVQEIEGLAFGHVIVGIENLNLRNNAGALERECCVGTDAATAADDGDFHGGKEVAGSE